MICFAIAMAATVSCNKNDNESKKVADDAEKQERKINVGIVINDWPSEKSENNK